MTSTASSRGPASRSKGCWASSARCLTAPAGVRVYRLSSPKQAVDRLLRPSARQPETPATVSGRSTPWTVGWGTGRAGLRDRELDALRANKHNTDGNRRVRFLPYGIAVGVLDEPTVISDSEITDSEITDEE